MNNPCENCGYYWQEEWADYPSCHYEGPHEWSPCEAADEADRIERERQEWEEEKRQMAEEYAEEYYEI